jgi:hypothetical protein
MLGLTNRPTLLVDSSGKSVGQPTIDRIGVSGPLGRPRIVSAIPLKDGPRLVQPARVLHDDDGAFLGDPSGNIIGDIQQVWVSRILMATRTPDTRRL